MKCFKYLSRDIISFFGLLLCFNVVLAQTPELSVQTGHSRTINSIKFSPDNNVFATASSDNTIILWDLKTGKQINILSSHKGPVNDILFHPNGKELYSVSDDGYLIVWDWKNGKILKRTPICSTPIKMMAYDEKENKLFMCSNKVFIYNMQINTLNTIDVELSGNNVFIDINPLKKQIAFGGEFMSKFYLYDYSQDKTVKEYPHTITSLRFSKNGQRLFAGGEKGELKKWELSRKHSASSYNIIETYMKHNRTIYSIETDSLNFYVANKEKLIYCYDMKGQVRHILKGHTKNPKCMALNSDGKLLLSAGEDLRVYVWNTVTGKLITTIKGISNNISDLIYTKNGQGLVLAFETGHIKYWDFASNTFVNYNLVSDKIRWKYNLLKIDSVSGKTVFLDAAFFKKFRKTDLLHEVIFYKVTWDITKNEVSLTDYKKKKYSRSDNIVDLLAPNEILDERYNPKSKLFMRYKSDSIDLYKEKKTEPLLSFKTNHKGGIGCVAFNETYNYLTTVGKDGMLKNWNFNGELTGILGAFDDKDFLLMNKDNYYYTSKGALKNIGYRIQSNIFSFDQFDLKYNRPDLALMGFPYIDSLLLDSYKNAYLKRLKKSEFNETDIIIEKNAPILKVDLPGELYTEIENFDFVIHASDSMATLEKLFITVNGVPVGSKLGEKLDQKSLDRKTSIILSPGENNVQVYVANSVKSNSLKQSFRVVLKEKKQKPDLFLVCIGAGHYLQKKYDLEYAEKDAKDIITLFTNSKQYQKIHTKLLLDSSVRRDCLEPLKRFVAEAKVNDVVIVFVAGHGILDKNLDYYLSTYDVDFAEPSGKGISYDALDNILDNIASRKKVLLIDACHSGEIDKDEMEMKTGGNPEPGDKLTFRTAGTSIQKKGDLNLKSSFELSKMLFADMRLNNGTTVISSAGGAEYALESSEWKNGAFTFCLLKGLKNKTADLNKDDEILLSELEEYLSATVSKLTNGKQVSTSRAENLQNDFRIW